MLVIDQQRKLNYQTTISAFKRFSCSSKTLIICSCMVEQWGMSESQRSSFSIGKICCSWGFSITLRDWPIISHNPEISILRLTWPSATIHSIIASTKASGEYSWAWSNEPLVSSHDCWPCLHQCWITWDHTAATVILISSWSHPLIQVERWWSARCLQRLLVPVVVKNDISSILGLALCCWLSKSMKIYTHVEWTRQLTGRKDNSGDHYCSHRTARCPLFDSLSDFLLVNVECDDSPPWAIHMVCEGCCFVRMMGLE